MLSNCSAREDSWESLGQHGDQTSRSERKSALNIHWKDWYWSWSSNTLAIWCKELTHWKRLWCWGRLKSEKRATEAEMVWWHHQFNGHELGQTPGDGEGQGSLVCYHPWGCRVRHDLATEQQQPQSSPKALISKYLPSGVRALTYEFIWWRYNSVHHTPLEDCHFLETGLPR